MFQVSLNPLRPALLGAAALVLAVLAPVAIAQGPEHAPEPRAGEPYAGQPDQEAASAAVRVSLADLYAPAPELAGAVSLFHHADLGLYASRAAAQSRWSELAAAPVLAGLRPDYEEAGGEIRLTAGPLESRSAVEALCVELSVLGGPCRPVAPMRAW